MLPIPDQKSIILDLAQCGDGSLVVCGTRGYLAMISDSGSLHIELPTDAHLCGVFCLGAEIWVCGYGAVLFHYDGTDWEQIDPGGVETDFLGFVRFEGKLLMAAETAIHEVRPDGIFPFAEVDNRRLSILGDTLFCSTPYSAHRREGTEWVAVDLAFDIPDIPTATAVPKG